MNAGERMDPDRARLVRTALLAASAFLVTLAALLRFHVYGQLAVFPPNQHLSFTLESPSATYFDTATYKVRRGVPVTQTVAFHGDPAAGDERTAVWTEFSSLETGDGRRVDYHERRSGFDRRTGMIRDCCDGYVDDGAEVRQSGLAFFPPPGAQPRTYPVFDTVLRRQVRLGFEGREEVAGLPVYRYSYTAGPVPAAEPPVELPGTVLGRKTDKPVTAVRYTWITRTLWMEPESGLPVRVREERTDTLRTGDGKNSLIAFTATLETRPDDVAALAARASGSRALMIAVRDVVPLVLLVLAPPAAVAAWLPRRRAVPPAGPEGDAAGTAAPEDGAAEVSGGAGPAADSRR